MSVYENQVQATAKYYNPEMRKIEHNDALRFRDLAAACGSRSHRWSWRYRDPVDA